MIEIMKKEMRVKMKAKIDRQKSGVLIAFIAVFIAGYVLFFSSPAWMPGSAKTGIAATETGAAISGNQREVTLVSWLYSSADDAMEVQLEISSMALDGINRYEWTAAEANAGMLRVKVMEEEDDFVVLRITDLPKRWREVSLRMNLKEEDAGRTDFAEMKFYTTRDDVEKVGKLEKKTLAEYRRDAVSERIEALEEDIKSLDKKISRRQHYINLAEEKYRQLVEDEKYQTPSEISETEEKRVELKNEIEAATSQMQQWGEEKEEACQRIELLKQKAKEY